MKGCQCKGLTNSSSNQCVCVWPQVCHGTHPRAALQWQCDIDCHSGANCKVHSLLYKLLHLLLQQSAERLHSTQVSASDCFSCYERIFSANFRQWHQEKRINSIPIDILLLKETCDLFPD